MRCPSRPALTLRTARTSFGGDPEILGEWEQSAHPLATDGKMEGIVVQTLPATGAGVNEEGGQVFPLHDFFGDGAGPIHISLNRGYPGALRSSWRPFIYAPINGLFVADNGR